MDFVACHKGGVPALMGTEREFIIKRRSGKPRSISRDSRKRAIGWQGIYCLWPGSSTRMPRIRSRP